ncbi:MAG: carboxymuconolactone decarboxylase family protein [Terriglobia bacterium]
MARISAIPKERAATLLKSLYADAEKRFGFTPNLFRTLAHRPELLITFANFYRELWTGGVLDTRTKELVALRVAVLNGCHY